MQYDEFIQKVQDYAALETDEEAVQATEAVLSALGELLYRSDQSDLATQLPRGVGEMFVARQPPENTRREVERFSLEDFYHRVGARTNTRHPQAVALAHAVARVLQEAVSAGEIQDAIQALPAGYDKLFQETT